MPKMKQILLLATSTSLLALTACQSTPTVQPPGNALNAILLHDQWQAVATQYPQFAAFVAMQASRQEYEQECTKARLLGALKEKKARAKIPQIPPAPPKPTVPSSPPSPPTP